MRSNKNQLKLIGLTLSLHLWRALPTLLHSECFGISTTMLEHRTAPIPPPRRTYNIDAADPYSLSRQLYIFRILIISNSTHFLRYEMHLLTFWLTSGLSFIYLAWSWHWDYGNNIHWMHILYNWRGIWTLVRLYFSVFNAQQSFSKAFIISQRWSPRYKRDKGFKILRYVNNYFLRSECLK